MANSLFHAAWLRNEDCFTRTTNVHEFLNHDGQAVVEDRGRDRLEIIGDITKLSGMFTYEVGQQYILLTDRRIFTRHDLEGLPEDERDSVLFREFHYQLPKEGGRTAIRGWFCRRHCSELIEKVNSIPNAGYQRDHLIEIYYDLEAWDKIEKANERRRKQRSSVGQMRVYELCRPAWNVCKKEGIPRPQQMSGLATIQILLLYSRLVGKEKARKKLKKLGEKWKLKASKNFAYFKPKVGEDLLKKFLRTYGWAAKS